MILCTTFSLWLQVPLIIMCYIYFPFQSTLSRIPESFDKDRINRSNQVVFTVPFSQCIFAKREFKWEFYFWKRKAFLEPLADKPDKRLMFCVNPVEIVWKRRYQSVLQIFRAYRSGLMSFNGLISNGIMNKEGTLNCKWLEIERSLLMFGYFFILNQPMKCWMFYLCIYFALHFIYI